MRCCQWELDDLQVSLAAPRTRDVTAGHTTRYHLRRVLGPFRFERQTGSRRSVVQLRWPEMAITQTRDSTVTRVEAFLVHSILEIEGEGATRRRRETAEHLYPADFLLRAGHPPAASLEALRRAIEAAAPITR